MLLLHSVAPCKLEFYRPWDVRVTPTHRYDGEAAPCLKRFPSTMCCRKPDLCGPFQDFARLHFGSQWSLDNMQEHAAPSSPKLPARLQTKRPSKDSPLLLRGAYF